MILAALILLLSTAIFCFYLQVTCQRILRRRFERDYCPFISNVLRLEFLTLRRPLQESSASLDHSRLSRALKCDFLALTHLLKNTVRQGSYSKEQRLLILYFRWQFLSLAVRGLLRMGEKGAALRLISVLEYFANVVGQRLYADGFGDARADCLVNC